METTDSILDQIKKDIKSNRVLLYMKGTKENPVCGFSFKVVEILNHLGVDYETRNILDSDELRSSIKEYSNWPTLPQLYIDGEFIGGCDIITELFDSGELKKILEA